LRKVQLAESPQWWWERAAVWVLAAPERQTAGLQELRVQQEQWELPYLQEKEARQERQQQERRELRGRSLWPLLPALLAYLRQGA
jgi:hypothetical protein